jgi:hypothetical protein
MQHAAYSVHDSDSSSSRSDDRHSVPNPDFGLHLATGRPRARVREGGRPTDQNG